MIVAALYKFVTLDDLESLQTKLKDLASTHALFGTLLLAHEGINGTVSGSRSAIDALKNFLSSDERFLGMEYKESVFETNPFFRMKVKIKKEIVTFGQDNIDPHKSTGTHVEPKDWDKLIHDPEVTVLDVRNFYEVELGKFKRTLDPNLTTFREFPNFVKSALDPKVNKKIAMSCTGGIRCEKASAYLKSQGFDEVYQLKGGILRYLENTPKEKSNWLGECFVFDQRVSVDHDLKKGQFALCFGCRLPLTEKDKTSPHYLEGVQCHRCVDTRGEKQKQRARVRQKQVIIAKSRGKTHIGKQAKL